MPPNLNFFNVGNKKEKQRPKSARASTDKMSSCTSTSTEVQKQDTCQKNVTKVKPVVPDKKKVPNTIHKSISKLKTATSTVQALKKKYQEQRLAKQRIKNKKWASGSIFFAIFQLFLKKRTLPKKLKKIIF